MADHAANGPVVYGHICLGVKERRLQNGSREHNLIKQRVVVGVHGLGCHVPFITVHGLVQPCQPVAPFICHTVAGIAVHITFMHIKLA